MPDPVAFDDWILIQGESVTRVYNFENPDETPFDLTGYSVVCQFRRFAADIDILLSPAVAITNAVNGQVTLTVTAEQSALLTGVFVFDIKVFNSSGSTVLRLVMGSVSVSPAVTH